MKTLTAATHPAALGAVAMLALTLTACGGSSAAPSLIAPQPTPSVFATSSPGHRPTIAGCQVFPTDNPWNQDISRLPVDARSDMYMASMNGATAVLHAAFGADQSSGIPFIVVPGSQPFVPMTFLDHGESDPGPYPYPSNAPIQVGSDHHVIVIDSGNCHIYETFAAQYVGPGWYAGSGAIFDLNSDALRPDGWTSADAAGLPIFAGLVRYSEVRSGEIDHALRFVVHETQRAWVHPATHSDGQINAAYPPMGTRIRLKASFDLSPFTGTPRIILVALKKYGMFLADTGADWYITGETNPNWKPGELSQLSSVPASQFEVVKLGPILH